MHRSPIMHASHGKPLADLVMKGVGGVFRKQGVGDSYLFSASDVRSYAERLHKAWTDFYEKDIDAWVTAVNKKASLAEEGIVTGDTIGGSKLTTEQKDFLASVADDMASFEAYRAKISTFDLFGDTPSEAWGKLQVFEKTLNEDRSQFKSVTGRSLKSQKPTSLEDPEGYVDPSKAGKSTFPWTGVLIVAGLAAAAYLVVSVTGLVRLSKVPSFY